MTAGTTGPLLAAWLSARSIARGLPAPVPDHGGLRVDTNAADERARWVFAEIGPGLRMLGRSITGPRRLLKLCGDADDLMRTLPAGWTLHAPAHFMQAGRSRDAGDLPTGYDARATFARGVWSVDVLTRSGTVVASGHAVETADVFVYDRIVTRPEHRRIGLARAVMTTLRSLKERTDLPEVLVATDEGRAFYAALGWDTLSPYSTASRSGPCDVAAGA